MTRLAVKDLAFEQINSVEFEAGWAFGEITIYSAGQETKITKLTAAETQHFAEMVRNLSTVETSGSSAPINRPDASALEAGALPKSSQKMLERAEVMPREPSIVSSAISATAAANEPASLSHRSISGDAEQIRDLEGSAERKVSVPLGIGIAMLPGIFVWFLLRQGHSTSARLIGFGWAGLLLLISASTFDLEPTSHPAPKISSGGDALPQSIVEVTPDPLAPWAEEGDGVRVTKAGFQARKLVWPLTVSSAIIGCDRGALLWVEANGEKFGLNGAAQDILNLARFDAVWAADENYAISPNGDVMRVRPDDLLVEARKLCSS